VASKSITTPKGIALWPNLLEPDTKFDAEGVYNVKLKLEGDDAEKLQAIIDKGIKASAVQAKEENPKKKIKVADAPYHDEVDEEDEPTGAVIFNFKLKAIGKNGKTGKTWKQKPALFDAKGKPCQTEVTNGSAVRVNFVMVPFYTPLVGAGVSLRLQAVQIIELAEGWNKDASAYGFDEEEGFEADDDAPPFTEEDDDYEGPEETDAEEEDEDDF